MALCSKCGWESSGRFCAQCGSPQADPAQSASGTEIPRPSAPNEPPGNVPPYASSRGPSTPPAATAALDDNVASALCYSLWCLTGILFLVLEPYKNNKTVRFHAFQSIFAGLAVTILFYVLSTLAFVPLLGLLFSAIFLIYPLAWLALWVTLMYKAYNRERFLLPIIGPLAEKQA